MIFDLRLKKYFCFGNKLFVISLYICMTVDHWDSSVNFILEFVPWKKIKRTFILKLDLLKSLAQ